MEPVIRNLNIDDLETMLEINDQGLPGTGKVSLEEMAALLNIAELAIGWFDGRNLCGFVICLSPNVDYGSPNYAWFNERYAKEGEP